MLFNSYVFVLVFLPLVLLGWWNPRLSARQRMALLTLASYLFYGWWDYRFVGLLLLSTAVDFCAGRQLHRAASPRARAGWLMVSLSANLGVLSFFKYSGFFTDSINALAQWLRLGGTLPVPEIILPVGISFYTFQTMSYSIDIYRRQAKPTESFWHFAAYVSLFPQLIAGPIVRYQELDGQLRSLETRVNWRRFAYGVLFFVVGMVQKVLLADTIASKIGPLFQDYGQLRLFGSWFAVLGYTCQLYFDFCGYSNMAVGLGRMLGFEFPQNFDSPYKSSSISEFWRRWHISLSAWLRDYLFIPLGGSAHGRWLTIRNLVIVMLLGGLWHGAGWTFVLWGLYHGLLLAGHRLVRSVGRFPAPQSARVAVTFVLVVFGWVIFRSTDMAMCGQIWQAMVGLHGCEVDILAAAGGLPAWAVLATLLAIVFGTPNLWQLRLPLRWPTAVVLSFAFVVCVLRFGAESPFLYFQF